MVGDVYVILYSLWRLTAIARFSEAAMLVGSCARRCGNNPMGNTSHCGARSGQANRRATIFSDILICQCLADDILRCECALQAERVVYQSISVKLNSFPKHLLFIHRYIHTQPIFRYKRKFLTRLSRDKQFIIRSDCFISCCDPVFSQCRAYGFNEQMARRVPIRDDFIAGLRARVTVCECQQSI